MSNDRLNGHKTPPVVISIPGVPVTVERKPFVQPVDEQRLPNAGTARANIAASVEKPHGTTTGGYAARRQDQSVLQQHCEFFDEDRDGVIWPGDTFRGFRRLGFGIFLSILSVFIIHSNFSYPTVSGILPDPFFRLFISNVHKDKHGSDTGTYDTEGRFIPQRFEDIFTKYGGGRDYLTFGDLWNLHKGQRLLMDPIGWFANVFEWLATYIMLWPEDGKVRKEDIRGIYDGSIFYTIAAKRSGKS